MNHAVFRPTFRPPFRPAAAAPLSLTVAAALLTACGGGGGGAPEVVAPPSSALVSGLVAKGPVGGASVCAYAITGGAKGAQLGCTTTSAAGEFQLRVGADGVPVLFEAEGGSYDDELAGAARALDTRLRSALTLVRGENVSVVLTPLTELAMRRAEGAPGGWSDASINDAMSMMTSAFGTADVRRIRPSDPTQAASASATRTERAYGLALAGFSAQSQSGTVAAALQAMVDRGFKPDLAGSQQAAFTTALNAFLASPRNRTGVTAATLAQQVRLQFNVMPLALGVLPSIPSTGGPVLPPVVDTGGPACVIAMTPQPGNITSSNYRVCVRPVDAAACNATALSAVFSVVNAFSVISSLGPVAVSYQAVDGCQQPDINEIIDR